MKKLSRFFILLLIIALDTVQADSFFINGTQCFLNQKAGEGIAIDIDVAKMWINKAKNIANCDDKTLMFLLKNRSMEIEILIGLGLQVTHENYRECRRQLELLLAEENRLYQQLLEKQNQFNNMNCLVPPENDKLYQKYMVRMNKGVRVRSHPLLGTNSKIKAKLATGHVVTLMDKVTGEDGQQWGQFFYEKNKKLGIGWIRFDLVTKVE